MQSCKNIYFIRLPKIRPWRRFRKTTILNLNFALWGRYVLIQTLLELILVQQLSFNIQLLTVDGRSESLCFIQAEIIPAVERNLSGQQKSHRFLSYVACEDSDD